MIRAIAENVTLEYSRRRREKEPAAKAVFLNVHLSRLALTQWTRADWAFFSLRNKQLRTGKSLHSVLACFNADHISNMTEQVLVGPKLQSYRPTDNT